MPSLSCRGGGGGPPQLTAPSSGPASAAPLCSTAGPRGVVGSGLRARLTAFARLTSSSAGCHPFPLNCRGAGPQPTARTHRVYTAGEPEPAQLLATSSCTLVQHREHSPSFTAYSDLTHHDTVIAGGHAESHQARQLSDPCHGARVLLLFEPVYSRCRRPGPLPNPWKVCDGRSDRRHHPSGQVRPRIFGC